jgi:hypothetical protein
MEHVAVASLEEYRQAKNHTEFRQKLHQEFDRWLERVEQEMNTPKPTLSQLTEVVFTLRQELTQCVTENLLQQAYAAEQAQETARCPECGQTLPARKQEDRVVETMVGAISLCRSYFYCLKCRKGFYPLDEALDLAPRRKQLDLQKAMVRLTTEVPYETASELCAELTGLSVSAHTAHAVTNEVAEGLGGLEGSPPREDIAARIAEVAQEQKGPPIVVLGIDGAQVPTRPETAKGTRPGRKTGRAKRARWQGEWREAKGFRWYVVDADRIVPLLSWHQMQEDEDLFTALQRVKEAGLIPEEGIRLCGVADGAPWIWKRVQGLFPTAQAVLDYYHCSGYIHRIAETQYGDRPAKALEWVEATMARLFCDEIAGVIWGLERMQPRTKEAAIQITKGLRSLDQHQNRIHYGSVRKAGYPIGSGGMESANQFICHVRLKRFGAWWYVANGNKILALRCAKYNGTFHRIFARYKK